MDPSALFATARRRVRDLMAMAAAATLIVGSVLALVGGKVSMGLTLVVVGDRVYISSVESGSIASREGYRPGMAVVALNGVQLLELQGRGQTYAGPEEDPVATDTPPPSETPGASPAAASGSPVTEASEGPVPSSPAAAPIVPAASPSPTPRPAAVPWGPGYLEALITGPIWQLDATFEGSGQRGYPDVYLGRDYVNELGESGYLLAAGLLLLASAWWLVSTGRAGSELRSLSVQVAAAMAIPLLARPLEATWAVTAMQLAWIVVPFGLAPLGLALADRVVEAEGRGVARLMVVGATALAMLLSIARGYSDQRTTSLDLLWVLVAGSIVVVPGLLASIRPSGAAATGRGVLQSNALVVAATTPLASLATGISSLPLFLPLSAWLGAVVVANRWTVRPLARVAARASLQRDLVVAATEAERARVAAEIHDDALQELTLLVRRLDETGDAESAEIARNVSDRLRAICGDLRLPVLDDLGVGPALDWLAERMERLAGGPVVLERTGDARLPADVELAFFRIAQEAVGNAVKHGKPPITIRYHATPAGASLAVDDAGPGIDPRAGERADVAAAAASAEGLPGGAEDGGQSGHPGRFGILNMQQRAEQIGALLDIRPWPGGGTHVALEWRAS